MIEADKDAELRRKAYKRVIELCENSLNRDVAHMSVQCNSCAQCKLCKNMKLINASSYNAYREEMVMEELVQYTPEKDGEPGYFTSALPIKPYNIGTIRDNKESADM